MTCHLHAFHARISSFARPESIRERSSKSLPRTSQGEAVHAAMQEIADVVAVPELADLLPRVDGDVAELLLEAVEQFVPDEGERV